MTIHGYSVIFTVIIASLLLLSFVEVYAIGNTLFIDGVSVNGKRLEGRVCERLVVMLIGINPENTTLTDARGPYGLDAKCTAEIENLRTDMLYTILVVVDMGREELKQEVAENLLSVRKYYYFLVHPVPYFTETQRYVTFPTEVYTPSAEEAIDRLTVNTTVSITLVGDHVILSNATIVDGVVEGSRIRLSINPGEGAGLFYVAISDMSELVGLTLNGRIFSDYLYFRENGTLVWNQTVGQPTLYNYTIYIEPIRTSLQLIPSSRWVDESYQVIFQIRLVADDAIDLSGIPVVVERRVGGEWVRVAEVRTDSSGGASLTLREKPSTEEYVFRASFAGNKLLQPSSSNIVMLRLTPQGPDILSVILYVVSAVALFLVALVVVLLVILLRATRRYRKVQGR